MEPNELEEAKEEFRQWLMAALEEHRKRAAKEREGSAEKSPVNSEFTAEKEAPKEEEKETQHE